MDPTVLQDALRLGEVLEGAVDAGREVGHIPGLQHELGPPRQEASVSRPHRPPFPPSPAPTPRAAPLTGT